MVPLQAYVSDSRLYSLHENLLKRLLKKKKQKQQKTEKTNIFFLQQVEQTLTLCTIIRHAYFNTFITKGYLYFEAVNHKAWILFTKIL
jgi:hypothetical protein